MSGREEIITALTGISKDPKGAFEEALSGGRKVIGVMPYFVPEELVYAAGMLPFGLWGSHRTVTESRRYFPAFYCSIVHTVLDMGIKGELAGLSAIIVPMLCDSLKSMGPNLKYGVPDIPVLSLAFGQNRKIPAGIEFTASQFAKLRKQLEEISGTEITKEKLLSAIRIYDENRLAVRAFSAAAAEHPDIVSACMRADCIKAGYFMDRKEHTALLSGLTALLSKEPVCTSPYTRVVTTGILFDDRKILSMLDERRICIAADQVAYESVNTGVTAGEGDDPVRLLAERFSACVGASVLFDPEKDRGRELIRLVSDAEAEAVLWSMQKFCDPEEYDYVPVKRMLGRAGIPLLSLEADQQTVNYGQIATQLDTFKEMMELRA